MEFATEKESPNRTDDVEFTPHSTRSSLSIIRYFLPNPARILPALTEKSEIKSCCYLGLNSQPPDHQSNGLLTELSHYLVVGVNYEGLYEIMLY